MGRNATIQASRANTRLPAGTVLFYDDFAGTAFTAPDTTKWLQHTGQINSFSPTYGTNATWTGSTAVPGNCALSGDGRMLLVLRKDGPQQILAIGYGVNAGTYSVSLTGGGITGTVTTSSLAYNASNTTIQTAMNAALTGSGNTVAVDVRNGTFGFTFSGTGASTIVATVTSSVTAPAGYDPNVTITRFTGTSIWTRKGFTPPIKIETRYRMDTFPGMWGGTWMTPPIGTGTHWPYDGEYDIEEIISMTPARGGPQVGWSSVTRNTIIMGNSPSTSTVTQHAWTPDYSWDFGTAEYTNLVGRPKPSSSIIRTSVPATLESGGAITNSTTGLPSNFATALGTTAGFPNVAKYTMGTGASGRRDINLFPYFTQVDTLANVGVVIGDVVSAGAWVAANWGGAGAAIRITIQDASFRNQFFDGNVITDPNGGFSYIENFTIPATVSGGTAPVKIGFSVGGTATTFTAGNTLQAGGVVVVKGAELPRNGISNPATGAKNVPQYADGDTPGWHWNGGTNTSTSYVTGWHVHTTNWWPNRIQQLIDGVVISDFHWPADAGLLSPTLAGVHWPFDGSAPQALGIDLVCGGWPGTPTTDPYWTTRQMEVDYVSITSL